MGFPALWTNRCDQAFSSLVQALLLARPSPRFKRDSRFAESVFGLHLPAAFVHHLLWRSEVHNLPCHQREGLTIDIYEGHRPGSSQLKPTEGALSVEVHAKNLTKTFTQRFPVRVQPLDMSPWSEALKLVEQATTHKISLR